VSLRKSLSWNILSSFISFDALVQRYEPPESRHRWDAPLFELTPDDELPIEQIADYLANKRPPPPNKSTVNVS
jgi:protein KTI12